MDRRLTNWKCGLPKDVKLKLRAFGAVALIASIEQSRTAISSGPRIELFRQAFPNGPLK